MSGNTDPNAPNTEERDVEDEIHHLAPTNLLMKENVAIALSYFAVGFVSSFISTPLNIYMVGVLNAEPPVQNTIGILQTLPWSLKLLFGFVSDAFPINGMHRKPYLTMGALIYSAAYISYACMGSDSIVLLALCIFLGTLGLIELDVMADTMCVERSKYESESRKGQMQASCYSIRFGGGLVGALLGAGVSNQKVWGWGLSYHQVSFVNGCIPFLLVTPWLYVLKEKYHKTVHYVKTPKKKKVDIEMRGTVANNTNTSGTVTQSYELISSSNGSLGSRKNSEGKYINSSSVSESTSLLPPSRSMSMNKSNNNNNGIVYQSFDPIQASNGNDESHMLSVMHISRAQSFIDEEVISLKADDDDQHETHPIILQLQEIWETVQLQAVWRPMAFVYFYNLLQVPNVAWQSYLQLCLGFPAWVLGLTVTLGSFMTFAGILAYKYLFFKASWRSIYVWTSVLTAFFAFLQILLIFQVNIKYLHLSNYLFSLGDDVISAYISGIQFLPVCVMYMRLCPDGSEGASYAMLTTFSNIALVCASNLGNHLAGVWDVSNEAMRSHEVSGLWKLSVLTSTLALVPLSLLWLLPKNAEEQQSLAKSKVKSKFGGAMFLLVLFGSLAWTISTAVIRLYECQLALKKL